MSKKNPGLFCFFYLFPLSKSMAPSWHHQAAMAQVGAQFQCLDATVCQLLSHEAMAGAERWLFSTHSLKWLDMDY